MSHGQARRLGLPLPTPAQRKHKVQAHTIYQYTISPSLLSALVGPHASVSARVRTRYPGATVFRSCYAFFLAHSSTLDNPVVHFTRGYRRLSIAPTTVTNTARASPSGEMSSASSATSPPKPPPCKETICSSKKDAFKSMLAAQSSKPGPSAPAAPCPPDREELGRHTWTLVRVRATPAHPKSHALHATLVSPDAHDGCVFSREAHRRRARGCRLLPTRAGWALPVRPLR